MAGGWRLAPWQIMSSWAMRCHVMNYKVWRDVMVSNVAERSVLRMRNVRSSLESDCGLVLVRCDEGFYCSAISVSLHVYLSCSCYHVLLGQIPSGTPFISSTSPPLGRPSASYRL